MENNLELYKIFYTVAKSGNISLASQKLFISQPAVSKSIKKLEAQLGIELFIRNSRGVKLTEEGKIFYKYVEKGLNEISIGEKVLGKLKDGEEGNIKLGVSTTLCKHFLIPKLKKFKKAYPNIKINIINNTSSDTLKLIDNGEIDLCVISEPMDKNDNYNFIKLLEIQDIFVASKEYLDTLNTIEAEHIFYDATVMFLEKDNVTRRYIDKYFQDNGLDIKPDMEISNMDLLMEFAKIGFGITAAIKEFIAEELKAGELIEIPIKPEIPKRNIGIVYSSNLPLSKAAETLKKYL
ncbi:LysR family transcriptional regulator [Clostridium sp. 19966]|uniref:LysR family transcriptional regulator n=1 Tax=Clostridium sp. 19966 TaxID=2768166 RepID=UPI0028DFC789|nr:LysR family transcriptional regulator [Clostridium sp. 19966]MDT8717920.1 LysR family transcriptional regulator [Clostridium sp. 19966]